MQNSFAWLMVLATVLLTTYGQFVIKWQVGLAGVLPQDAAGKLHFLMRLLTNPLLLSGLAAALAASLTWMLAITRLPLSHAYPFTAATFVLVVIGGSYLFSEPLTLARVIGVCLIVVGVVLTGIE